MISGDDHSLSGWPGQLANDPGPVFDAEGRMAVRVSRSSSQASFGHRLRADMLHALIGARSALADHRLPLPARLSGARTRLRKARMLLKACRDTLGPSFAPRAARLKLSAGALKALATDLGSTPVGLVLAGAETAPESDRRISEIDGMLRRCEVDAVSLAPGLIDAVGAAQALAKARRQSRKRAKRALKSRDPEHFRRWLKALRRQVDMAQLLAGEWRDPASQPLLQLSGQAEDLARYLKVDALYRRLCAQMANGTTPMSSPEAVRLERKTLLKRLKDRQMKILSG